MHLNDFECPSITIKGLPTSTANGTINTTPSNARLVGGIDNGRLMWVWSVRKSTTGARFIWIMKFDGPKGKYFVDIWEGGVERAGWTVRRRTKTIMSLYEYMVFMRERWRLGSVDV